MGPAEYEIVIQGRLERRQAEALGGFHVTSAGGAASTVRGRIENQEALHRLLTQIADLGLNLTGLRRLEEPGRGSAPASPDP
jgi:hypothetical protein